MVGAVSAAVDSLNVMSIGFRYQYEDSGSERSNRKRLGLLGKIRNVCPHITSLNPTLDDDGHQGASVHYALETHFGTMSYFCMMCGSEWSRARIDLLKHHLTQAFNNDPVGTIRNIHRDIDKTQKLIRKLNRRGGRP